VASSAISSALSSSPTFVLLVVRPSLLVMVIGSLVFRLVFATGALLVVETTTRPRIERSKTLNLVQFPPLG
jgi:hypothetical protein